MPAHRASAVNVGPVNEGIATATGAAQTLNFTVTNDNNALFSVQPAVTVSTTVAVTAVTESDSGVVASSVRATGSIASIYPAVASLTFTPADNANGTATVTVVLKDNGGTTGADGQPNGGVDTTAAQTFTITVNAVNDAPVLSPAPATALTSVYDVTTTPGDMMVSALLGTAANDNADTANGGTIQGMAVTALTLPAINNTANGGSTGQWQYALSGVTTWHELTGISTASSLLLPLNAKVRYLPAKGETGNAMLTFRAWDGFAGTVTVAGAAGTAPVEGRFSTSANGGTSAFSANAGTLTQEVISKSLYIVLPTTSISEADAALINGGTVRITRALATDLTVFVSSTLPDRLAVPVYTVIKAGQTSANFDITPVDNRLLDLSAEVALTVFTPEWESDSAKIFIADNEIPGLTLSMPPVVSEKAGTFTATLIASAIPVRDVTMNLSAGDALILSSTGTPTGATLESGITLPATIILKAGMERVNFTVTVSDNALLDGDRKVAVTATGPTAVVVSSASAVTALGEAATWGTTSVYFTIMDDDRPSENNGTLSLTLPADVFEDAGVIASAGRLTLSAASTADTTKDTVINLTSDNPAVTVPSTVTITAGSTEAFFNVTIAKDNGVSGALPVSVTAMASGISPAVATVNVFDQPQGELRNLTMVKGTANQVISMVVLPNTRAALAGTATEISSATKFTTLKITLDKADFIISENLSAPVTATGLIAEGAVTAKIQVSPSVQVARITDLYGNDLLARNSDGTPKVTVNGVSNEILMELASPAGLSANPTQRPLQVSFTGTVASAPVSDADGVARGRVSVNFADLNGYRLYPVKSGDGDLGGSISTSTLDYVLLDSQKPAIAEAIVEVTPGEHIVSPLNSTSAFKVYVRLPDTAANLDSTGLSGDGVNDVVISLPPTMTVSLNSIVRYTGPGIATGGAGLPVGTTLRSSVDFTEKLNSLDSTSGTRRYSFTDSMKVSAASPITLEFSFSSTMAPEARRHLVTASLSHVDFTKTPEVPGPVTAAVAGNADNSAVAADGTVTGAVADQALLSVKIQGAAPIISGMTIADVPATIDGQVTGSVMVTSYSQTAGSVRVTGSALVNSSGKTNSSGTVSATDSDPAPTPVTVYQAARISWSGYDSDSSYSTRLYWSLSDIGVAGVMTELARTSSALIPVSSQVIEDSRRAATPQPMTMLWHVLPLTERTDLFATGSLISKPVYIYAVAFDNENTPTPAGGQILKAASPMVIVKTVNTDTVPVAAFAWPASGSTASASAISEGSFGVSATGISAAGVGATVATTVGALAQTEGAVALTADTSASISVKVADDDAMPVTVKYLYSRTRDSLRAVECLTASGSALSFAVTPAVPSAAAGSTGAGTTLADALSTATPVAAIWNTATVPAGTYMLLARVYETGQPVVEVWSGFQVSIDHPQAATNTAPWLEWIMPSVQTPATIAAASNGSRVMNVSFRIADNEADDLSVTLYCNRICTEDSSLSQLGSAMTFTAASTTGLSTGHTWSGTVDLTGLASGPWYLLAKITETGRSSEPFKRWTQIPVIIDQSLGMEDLTSSAPYADPADASLFAVDITFRTTTPSIGSVWYGLNSIALTEVAEGSYSLGHKVTLSGLRAGVTYLYMAKAETDSFQSMTMDRNGRLYSLVMPAAAQAAASRWVKGAVSQLSTSGIGGIVKAYLVRAKVSAASSGASYGADSSGVAFSASAGAATAATAATATDTISEPFMTRISADGTFHIDMGNGVIINSNGTQTAVTPLETDLASVEILLDNGRRKFFQKLALTGITAATTKAAALELPNLWNSGVGVNVDSDTLETTIQLVRGYNLVALPMEPETPLTSRGLLGQLGSDAVIIASYSPTTGRFDHAIRTPFGILGSDFTLSTTTGFFVKVLNDTTFTMKARELLGRMGIDGLAAYKFENGVYSVVIRTGTDASGNPVYHAPDGDFEIRVGQGVFLKMYSQNTFMGE
ncbi:MAG: hypothetical protein CVV64_17240 [Candidatus Wallbacteria bacterium HGW-Wallbacteria-1]|uniref:Cadherin domain-containing protein n=1 Tax=Candidatus Wallbacteria bacterium HGW-Wallbacteria-1 TaxID=2013854 RepID=A0A2N1PKF0_9BACT|nr:MAG: hypothetical protein CVV64_17240 [Candidatus Wallbacteria bacterium HGW-Wallbacteria-1]